MKPATRRALVGSVLVALAAAPSVAASSHRHLHQRSNRNHTHGADVDVELVKERKLVNRAGQCAFPESEGLIAITPGELNAGWALSPDQECTAGSWCPFACPSGQLMNQWKKGTTYSYPESQYGGLYCDESGSITKPFEDEDYCVEGVGTVSAVNKCGDVVAVCQTVLPGNEAMLIPTSVEGSAVIAVPGTSYWDATAAHFYVNPPGYSTTEACVWGTSDKEIGNWSPYVIGANQDATGDTYVKLGWNPIYTDAFSGVLPTFGMKIECNGNCVGLPCSIDPSTDGFGGVNSKESATGAGGADFCVVTVTSGSADVVFFNTDGSTGGDSSGSSSPTSSSTTEKAEPTTTSAVLVLGLHAVPTSSSSSSSSTSTSTTSSSKTTTSSTSTSSSISSASSSTEIEQSTTSSSYTTLAPSSSHHASSVATTSTVKGGIFQEYDSNSTATQSAGDSATVTSSANLADATTGTAPAATTSSKSDASNSNQSQGAFAGLVVAIVAAACLY